MEERQHAISICFDPFSSKQFAVPWLSCIYLKLLQCGLRFADWQRFWIERLRVWKKDSSTTQHFQMFHLWSLHWHYRRKYVKNSTSTNEVIANDISCFDWTADTRSAWTFFPLSDATGFVGKGSPILQNPSIARIKRTKTISLVRTNGLLITFIGITAKTLWNRKYTVNTTTRQIILNTAKTKETENWYNLLHKDLPCLEDSGTNGLIPVPGSDQRLNFSMVYYCNEIRIGR